MAGGPRARQPQQDAKPSIRIARCSAARKRRSKLALPCRTVLREPRAPHPTSGLSRVVIAEIVLALRIHLVMRHQGLVVLRLVVGTDRPWAHHFQEIRVVRETSDRRKEDLVPDQRQENRQAHDLPGPAPHEPTVRANWRPMVGRQYSRRRRNPDGRRSPDVASRSPPVAARPPRTSESSPR